MTLVIQTVATGVLEIRIEREVEDIVSDNFKKIELLETMSESVHIVSRVVRSVMLLREDPAEAGRQRKKIDEARAKYDKAWIDLQKLPASDEGKKLREEITKAATEARDANNRVLELTAQGKYDAANRLLFTEARAEVEHWQETVDAYTVFQRRDNQAGYEKIKADFVFVERMTLTFSAIALLLSIFVAWFNSRSITKPLASLQDMIHRVQRGDASALQQITRRDELGDLGRSVNQIFDDQLALFGKVEADKEVADAARRKVEAENEALNNDVVDMLQAVHQIAQRDLTVHAPVSEGVMGPVADSVNSLTEETAKVLHHVARIAGRVEDVSQKVRGQADEVHKVATEERQGVQQMIDNLAKAVDHMTQVAELVNNTNQAAKEATESTDVALDRVGGTVRGMDGIRETIAETEKRIKRLGERSQEIGGIVGLINKISERTHVLALNAAMQAAIAGEAGRGFAVVAEEVQRLAESSQNATAQIETLVGNIRVETNETIATMNRTIDQVVEGSNAAQKAGEQMQKTQQITANLAALVQKISVGAGTQKTIAMHLQQRVAHIGKSTEKTAAQVEAQVIETRTLSDVAKLLVQAVGQFKLPKFVETAEMTGTNTRSLKKAA
ncbi:MAG: methyl-accepting chemotaxis protein [Burkholderiales bacterium]